MCAGSNAAKVANENAKRQEIFAKWNRFHKGMTAFSRYRIKKVQAAVTEGNIFQGLAGRYGSWSRAQQKYNTFKKNIFKKNEEFTKKLLTNSTYGKLLAAGKVTGKSVARMGVLEDAMQGEFFANNLRKLTDARDALGVGMIMSRMKAISAQDDTFAGVAFAPSPDIMVPEGARRSVAAAAMGDALAVIGTVAGVFAASDSRLKKDVRKIGTSIDGYNIYKFKYIDEENDYIGVMAEEVYKKKPEAVGRMDNGYLGVDYNQIDVEFREVA